MRVHPKCVALASVLLLLLPDIVSARPSPNEVRGIPISRAPATFDATAHMDANNLDMVVTNHGSFAYDLITASAGLVYPKGSGKTAVFAAGPWIGAVLNGNVRAAV